MSRTLQSFLVAFYAWCVTVFCGAVWLDVAYANALRGAVDAAQTALVFEETGGLLLLILGLAVLSGVAALAVAWQSRAAGTLLGASLLVLAGELVAPAVLGPVFVEPGSGWWLRLLLTGTASVLALLGLRSFLDR